MNRFTLEKIKDSVKSIAPISILVIIVSVISGNGNLLSLVPSFIMGSFLLMLGMFLFDIGAEVSMIQIGERIGGHLTKKKNVAFVLTIVFLIGFIITIAEPDLNVLVSQVPSISSTVLTYTIGFGVGFFLMLAVIRMLYKMKYSLLLTILCIIAFILAFFVPKEFVPLAFDAGGVTTGPLSVPLIIALGAGLSITKLDKRGNDNTFGLVSLCSIGPIIIVLILGLIYTPEVAKNTISNLEINGIKDMFLAYFKELPTYLKEVVFSLGPIVIIYLIYNYFYLKMKKKDFKKINTGLVLTYFGLVIFLVGVNVGFMPMGYQLGKYLSNFEYFLIPFAILLGYFVVSSEPAVAVLTSQIEDITNGNIKRKLMNLSLGIGVSFATGLAVLRVMTGLSIWYFLLPGYVVALLLSLYVPPIFTAIAFDSGGVASGTMTATFVLPFVIGIAESLGKNVLVDAFGLVAIVATIPLVTVQLIGLLYKFKTIKLNKMEAIYNAEIIDY